MRGRDSPFSIISFSFPPPRVYFILRRSLLPMASAYDLINETNEAEEGYKGYSVIPAEKIVGGYSQHLNGPGSRMRHSSSGLLEDMTSCLIVLTHSCFEKLTYLPFPVGVIVEAMEEAVDPYTHPLIHGVEGFTLRLLSTVDDQIYVLGTTVEGVILCASGQVKLLLNLLHKRGVVGTTADFWVQHEASLSEKTHAIIDLANKVPLLRFITPLICAIATPLVKAVSDWLVERSQSVEKSIQYQQDASKHQEPIAIEQEEIEKSRREEDVSTKDMDKAIDLGDETVKGKEGKEIRPEESTSPVEEKRRADNHRLDVGVHDDKENGEGLSNVLEMIDSGWLLGSPTVVSPRAIVQSPNKSMSAKYTKPRWV